MIIIIQRQTVNTGVHTQRLAHSDALGWFRHLQLVAVCLNFLFDKILLDVLLLRLGDAVNVHLEFLFLDLVPFVLLLVEFVQVLLGGADSIAGLGLGFLLGAVVFKIKVVEP